jgi:hypothetical protein
VLFLTKFSVISYKEVGKEQVPVPAVVQAVQVRIRQQSHFDPVKELRRVCWESEAGRKYSFLLRQERSGKFWLPVSSFPGKGLKDVF